MDRKFIAKGLEAATMEEVDPIITILRLVEEEDDGTAIARRFFEHHPELDRAAFLEACSVALDIIGLKPSQLH
ncbi:hypothetical protein D3218_06350 [Aureimonas flava]|uniref:Uncharacterized protein n=1 Tax=Aureimonas flava TaxID=2320271 RepID=A0A3A1WM61_9HYPH|nr:hypothetical protein [Aureimonas flava]RIY01941.1 hypothetical protein D3218_06350 [Aureimonas flava]